MCLRVRASRDKPSPADIVKTEAFHYDDNTGILTVDFKKINVQLSEVPKVWVTPIPDTDSMDPLFDYGHNNLLLGGRNSADQQKLIDFMAERPGNIAVYKFPNWARGIIHRIVEIGQDDQGRFFKFRGDNNLKGDPDKVRDAHITHLYAGTIP